MTLPVPLPLPLSVAVIMYNRYSLGKISAGRGREGAEESRAESSRESIRVR